MKLSRCCSPLLAIVATVMVLPNLTAQQGLVIPADDEIEEDTTLTSRPAQCSPGEVYDSILTICRPECDDGEVYLAHLRLCMTLPGFLPPTPSMRPKKTSTTPSTTTTISSTTTTSTMITTTEEPITTSSESTTTTAEPTTIATTTEPTTSTRETIVPTRRTRPSCKNITFIHDQYQIQEDNRVLVPLLGESISRSLFAETGTNLTLCYNYSEAFMRCPRWLLENDEFQQRGLRIWVPIYQRYYEPGDYFVRDGRAVVCVNQDSIDQHLSGFRIDYVYAATWIVSIISLTLAFVLLVSVPSLKGGNQMLFLCHIVSLGSAYIILVIRVFGEAPGSSACFAFGVLLQFCFLATFFWLNVIAFDICRTVHELRHGQGVAKRSSMSRYIFYMLYGWGSPFIIVLVSVLLDKWEPFRKTSLFQPQFHLNCWITNYKAKLALFYGPMALLLLLNIFMFILTMFNIRALSKDTVRESTKKNHQLLRTAVELVIVMGLCWIMEVVSWAVVGGKEHYWYFTDIINGLQGLFILIIFLIKPNVLAYVLDRLGLKRRPAMGRPEREGATYVASLADVEKEALDNTKAFTITKVQPNGNGNV